MSAGMHNPVFGAALALSPESRAELAGLLLDSLENSSGIASTDEALEVLGARLTAHFHRAKQVALSGIVEQQPLTAVSPADLETQS